uniref:LNR domain-containing protein n=1 Tax=Panagrellus redivivus TaxID=6233 RepID=A0A7E4W0F6_PANRE
MFEFINVTQIEAYLNSARIPVYELDHCQTRDYCDSVAKNNICDPVCDSPECDFDGGDCRETVEMLTCSKSCQALMTNGICNLDCNVELCGFDGGDCLFDGYAASQGVTLIFETTQKVPSARILREKLSKSLNLPVVFESDTVTGAASVHLLDMNYDSSMILNPASVLPVGSLLKATIRIDFRYCATPNAVCRFSNAAELVNWINAEPIEYLLDEFDIILYQAETTSTIFGTTAPKFTSFGLLKLTPMVKLYIACSVIVALMLIVIIIACCQSPAKPAVKQPIVEAMPSRSDSIYHSTPVYEYGHSFGSRAPLWAIQNTVLTSSDEFFKSSAENLFENNYTPRSHISEFRDSDIVIQKHTMHHFTEVTPKRYTRPTPIYRIPSPISMASSNSSIESIYGYRNLYSNDDTISP